jgi:hypothetical protein
MVARQKPTEAASAVSIATFTSDCCRHKTPESVRPVRSSSRALGRIVVAAAEGFEAMVVQQSPLTRLRDRLDDYFDRHPILGFVAFPIEIIVILLSMLAAGVALILAWVLLVFVGWGLWTLLDKVIG